MKTRMLIGVLALATPLIFSCSDEKKTTERRDGDGGGGGGDNTGGGAKAPASDKAFPAAQATATIKGTVVWAGAKMPKTYKLPIAGDDFCVKCYPDEKPPQEKTQIDAETKGIAHVFVQIKDAAAKWKFEVPAEPAVLDQVKCRYVPHTLGVMAGQKLIVRNSDSTTHNVHFYGRRNRLDNPNRTQVKGDKDEIVLNRVEATKFKCDIHGWMTANVQVVDHTLFAVSDEKGNFTLPKLPAGTYDVVAWHEDKKWKAEPVSVTVADGGTQTITINFKK